MQRTSDHCVIQINADITHIPYSMTWVAFISLRPIVSWNRASFIHIHQPITTFLLTGNRHQYIQCQDINPIYLKLPYIRLALFVVNCPICNIPICLETPYMKSPLYTSKYPIQNIPYMMRIVLYVDDPIFLIWPYTIILTPRWWNITTYHNLTVDNGPRTNFFIVFRLRHNDFYEFLCNMGTFTQKLVLTPAH